MTTQTIRLFEHQTLVVGQSYPGADGSRVRFEGWHRHALARFHERGGHRYYSLGHRSVRFRHYVGVLRVGRLTLEVLPKADRRGDPDSNPWHGALLGMLRIARRMNLRVPSEADQELHRHTLFDLYIARFLDAVEDLLHSGLVRGYRTDEGNRTTFKGRLVCARDIRENLARADRFYVAHQVYDHDHLANRLLAAAVDVVGTLALPAWLRGQQRRARLGFPEVGPLGAAERSSFERLILTRNTAHYREALALARLILRGHAPRLAGGRESLLAIMFDMNVLFEAFVSAMARRLELSGASVATQVRRRFWCADGHSKTIRPDLVIEREGRDNLVIDCKWKLPRDGMPGDADLKQMYVYNQYFDSARSVLLYPRPSGPGAGANPVAGRFVDAGHGCSTFFLDIFEHGRFSPEHVRRQLCALVADVDG